MKLTYTKGILTKASILRLIDDFDSKMVFNDMSGYKYNHSIHWQNTYVQNNIENFMAYLIDRRISFGNYRPYKDGIIGRIEFFNTL